SYYRRATLLFQSDDSYSGPISRRYLVVRQAGGLRCVPGEHRSAVVHQKADSRLQPRYCLQERRWRQVERRPSSEPWLTVCVRAGRGISSQGIRRGGPQDNDCDGWRCARRDSQESERSRRTDRDHAIHGGERPTRAGNEARKRDVHSMVQEEGVNFLQSLPSNAF
ncbi:hypothetical protein PFISCL1PPCAC_13404, partial [Pristionchus fissidentatus]